MILDRVGVGLEERDASATAALATAASAVTASAMAASLTVCSANASSALLGGICVGLGRVPIVIGTWQRPVIVILVITQYDDDGISTTQATVAVPQQGGRRPRGTRTRGGALVRVKGRGGEEGPAITVLFAGTVIDHQVHPPSHRPRAEANSDFKFRTRRK